MITVTMTKRFLIIAALALLVRVWVAYSEKIPLWMDEMAHGNYVAYICEHWSLPDAAFANEQLSAELGRSLKISYEHYQPPGYYILAAVFSGGSPIGARLVSVAMFMVALFFVWAASRDLVIACALSLIPGIVYATSVISNDAFLLLGSSIMFYACTKKKTWAIILGGAVLATSKFHGVPILAVIGIYYLVKRQPKWAMITGVFALAGFAITWWRWDLQKVNDAYLRILMPRLSVIGDKVSQALGTGVMHISPFEQTEFSFFLGVVIGVILVMKAYQ
ncbi:hypothetical protein ACFLQW_02810, partial [Candidatus Zixiibacteriota bacterium]